MMDIDKTLVILDLDSWIRENRSSLLYAAQEEQSKHAQIICKILDKRPDPASWGDFDIYQMWQAVEELRRLWK